MIDIFSEIDEITKKYEIDSQKFFKDQLEKLMGEILEEAVKKYGNRVIIRGLIKTEDKIHPFLTFIEKYMDIVAIHDRAQEKNDFIYVSPDKTVPLIPSDEDIPECDIYLINVMLCGPEIKFEMENRLDLTKTFILDLYYNLKDIYNLFPSHYYEYYTNEYDYTCRRIKDALKIYEKENSEESLLNLLGQCLCIGDFTSLFRIKKDEKTRIEQSVKLKGFVSDVESLINKINDSIKARATKFNGKKDIIWHWIDSVSYDELPLLPKIKQRIQNGIFFTEAYTPTPYTRPTVNTIFWKEFRKNKNNNNKSGEYKLQNLKNSKLFMDIMNGGYHFEAFGTVKKLIHTVYATDEKAEASVQSSINYLRMLHALLTTDKPCFFIVHTLLETHLPFTSPWENIGKGGYLFSYNYEDLRTKIEISSEYIDEVVDFYSNLIHMQTIGIYMSDHGKWGFIERRRYKDESIHTFLGITNMGIKAEVSRLFSYKDFDNMVEWILKLNGDSCEEMLIGDIELYSKGFRGTIAKRNGNLEDVASGFVGINTVKDKYVLLDNGTEYYFLKDDEETNHIGNTKYYRRINYLKDQLNNFLP